jgi:hypothetical protein
MARLVSAAFVVAGIMICLAPQPFAEVRSIPFDIAVDAAASGKPLAGASVRVIDAFRFHFTPVVGRGKTNANGHARFTARLKTSGFFNALGERVTLATWGHWLEISAPPYETRRVPLSDLVGPFPDAMQPAAGRLALAFGTSNDSAEPFRDVAGAFADGRPWAHGWCRLVIEADGRFTWSQSERYAGSKPSSRALGDQTASREYGYLKRQGAKFDLVALPRPDGPTDPRMPPRLRIVTWGRCVYLAPDNPGVLSGFCRAALTPKKPSKRLGEMRDRGEFPDEILSRSSDSFEPRTGLPRVPLTAWLHFMRDALDRNACEKTEPHLPTFRSTVKLRIGK